MKKFFLILLTVLAMIAATLIFLDHTPKILTSCPFCREEVIQRQLFYQGNEVLGITTHKPAVPGHVLIIPTRHVERFEELTPSEFAEMGETIRKVDQAVKNIYQTTGYLLIQKNGREAGQSVPHVHFHYLPVSEDTNKAVLALKFFISPWLPAKTGEEMRPEIASFSKEMSP